MATPTQPIEYGPSKVFIQRIGGTDEPVVGEIVPEDAEKEQRWWTGADTGPGFGETVLTAEVSTTPEARAALKRMFEQAPLDNMVEFIRAARARGFFIHHFTMPDELYRFSSAICHRLHNMNLTRYLRSKCLYPAKGIRVTLKSGAKVWKK